MALAVNLVKNQQKRRNAYIQHMRGMRNRNPKQKAADRLDKNTIVVTNGEQAMVIGCPQIPPRQLQTICDEFIEMKMETMNHFQISELLRYLGEHEIVERRDTKIYAEECDIPN